jgi:hypothetical protein
VLGELDVFVFAAAGFLAGDDGAVLRHLDGAELAEQRLPIACIDEVEGNSGGTKAASFSPVPSR